MGVRRNLGGPDDDGDVGRPCTLRRLWRERQDIKLAVSSTEDVCLAWAGGVAERSVILHPSAGRASMWMDIYRQFLLQLLGRPGILKMTRVYAKIWRSTLFGLSVYRIGEKRERDI